MGFLLAALLTAGPKVTPVPQVTARTGVLRAQLDLTGMITASWYVPHSRSHIDAAINNARGMLLSENELDGQGLLMASPVFGPWLVAGQARIDDGDRALLYTTGLLQLVGLSVGAMRLFSTEDDLVEPGPVMSFSPIAAGRLGFSLRIVGF